MAILPANREITALRAIVFALVAAAALTLAPLWAPLVLAAWVAELVRPIHSKIAHKMKGSSAASGLLVAMVLLILVPMASVIVMLSKSAIELVRSVMQSDDAKNALVALAEGGKSQEEGQVFDVFRSPQKIVELVQQHGMQAAHVASGVASAAAAGVVWLFVFLYAVYVFLVDGPSRRAWFVEHSPLDVGHTRRLLGAFDETGRGLFVGIGLTGLSQGIVATLAYVVLGVPRALVLGLLTCVASILPSVGTALVWVPVTAGLALAGQTTKAAIMAAIGIFVIGTIDNVLRPVFARLGKLELSTFTLLLSMFGGLAAFGGWGIFLGPLLVRLAKEGLVLAREDRDVVPTSPTT